MQSKKSDRPVPNVYLIDDDPVITFLLVDLVESVGLPYPVFNDAHSFLQQDLSNLAGCIVTDVRMPGMSGLELQDELKRRGHAIPIVFITGHGDVPMAVNAVKKGALEFIEKPFNDQALLVLIDNALAIDAATRRRAARFAALAARIRRTSRCHLRERRGVSCNLCGRTERMPGARYPHARHERARVAGQTQAPRPCDPDCFHHRIR